MMNLTIVLAISFIVMILLSVPSSVLFIQNASALASVAQITSAKADGANLINGGFATIAQDKNTVKVTFDYRGFDDNDHVLELRCSWDGVNYLKRNCSSESAESRTTFTGPDGVARTYYVKSGTASRELATPPVPKTYTFGVKVLNENGNLSPAATWTFKMRASTNPPVGGTQEGSSQSTDPDVRIKVSFDSITVHSDHDRLGVGPAKCCSGEWTFAAFVQGKVVELMSHRGDIDNGDTFKFPDKHVTVDIPGSRLPLSIFTLGYEDDSGFFQDCFKNYIPGGCGFCAEGYPGNIADIPKIFSGPQGLWKEKIHDLQLKLPNCPNHERLGLVNFLYLPPDYLSTLTPDVLEKFPEFFQKNMKNTNKSVKSSNGDFTMRYTISVEPLPRQ